MTFRFEKWKLAQALSIVGEQGIHGFEYNGLLTSWLSEKNKKRSKRFRFALTPAHEFVGKEFEEYLILAWRFGYLERSKYNEVDWKAGLNKSSYATEDEVVRLTEKGWEFVEAHADPVTHKWGKNIVENLPAVLFSVTSAIIISWLIH